MSEIPFKLKDMVGFNWNLLSDNQKENIVKYIFKFPLEGDVPHRFGFVKCEGINENQIFGYFTQEFEEEKHRYNDQKKEEKYIDKPFEDFFFIILFDAGLCLLQSRKIKNISMSTIEERFTEALKSVFKETGVDFDTLEDISGNVEKDDFIKIFNDENIVSLKVDSLKGRTIPEEYKIFNPDAEKDSIIRAFYNDSFRRLDKIYHSTDDSGGLQELKPSKILLYTGEPREMEIIGRDGSKLIVKDKFGPSFPLDINVVSPKTEDIRREVNKFSSNPMLIKVGKSIKGKSAEQKRLFSSLGDNDD
jgi:hypothetical protein